LSPDFVEDPDTGDFQKFPVPDSIPGTDYPIPFSIEIDVEVTGDGEVRCEAGLCNVPFLGPYAADCEHQKRLKNSAFNDPVPDLKPLD